MHPCTHCLHVEKKIGYLCKHHVPSQKPQNAVPVVNHCSCNIAWLARMSSCHVARHSTHASVGIVRCSHSHVHAVHTISRTEETHVHVDFFGGWSGAEQASSSLASQSTTHHLLNADILVLALEGHRLCLPDGAWLGLSNGSKNKFRLLVRVNGTSVGEFVVLERLLGLEGLFCK